MTNHPAADASQATKGKAKCRSIKITYVAECF